MPALAGTTRDHSTQLSSTTHIYDQHASTARFFVPARSVSLLWRGIHFANLPRQIQADHGASAYFGINPHLIAELLGKPINDVPPILSST